MDKCGNEGRLVFRNFGDLKLLYVNIEPLFGVLILTSMCGNCKTKAEQYEADESAVVLHACISCLPAITRHTCKLLCMDR